MIQAVIFDFGNVLCSFDLQRFQQNLLPFTSRTLDELHAIRRPVAELSIQYETGSLPSSIYFREIARLADLKMTEVQFIRAYTDIFTPIPSTSEVIRALKPRYRLGLLSNTNEWHFTHNIRTVDVYPLFDAVSLSYRVKAMKPARAIYDDMLRQLSLPPDVCVYIDDMEENVRAAEVLGMRGIWYRSHGELLQNLREVGVSV
jgi:putative hydrolase of the HAD superfamily